ncbi:TPA: sugar kinase [Candidatus Bathyarchaeota archaeon]|nr:sugar kinase [Candidatus Bathyarchaeota archaeon]
MYLYIIVYVRCWRHVFSISNYRVEKLNLNLKKERLIEILGSFRNLNVGIIGDFALDAYWYADMTRSEISRETPRFIRPVIKETYSPGGAGNVANNVKALKVNKVFGVTVFGDDWRGAILRKELEKAGISLEYSIISEDRITQTYVKPILMGYEVQQEDNRIDFININDLSEKIERDLIIMIEKCLKEVNVLLLADYLRHGVFTNKVRRKLNELAIEYERKIFVADSRTRIGHYKGMALKPNRIEAARAAFPMRDPQSFSLKDLEKVGRKLFRQAGKPVVITIGAEGALLFTKKENFHILAAPTAPPIDPVGAGDTFLASFGLCLGVNAEPWEAAAIANLAASVIIKKLNITGTASPEEIITKFEEIKKFWRDWPSQKT